MSHLARIALIAPFGLRAKGTARARTLPLARALARRGYAVAMFVPPYDSPEDSGEYWNDAGVEVVNLPLPQPLSGNPLWHARLARRLLRAVLAWQPDIVHVFKPKGPSGLAGTGLRAAGPILRGRPPVMVMDSDDWEGPGGWNDDPRTGYSPAQRRFFAWQERHGLAGGAGAWTVTTQCLKDRAVGFGADPRRVYLLPNGLPDDRFAAWSGTAGLAGAPDGRAGKVLLYTRFAGVQAGEVASIWRGVLQQAPEASLVIAGRGLAGEETALARDLPNVQAHGWTDPAAMPALFAGMRLAIVPWADTRPNRARSSVKLLELMAAGLPIVAYAVGDVPAIVGDTGIVVPPGDTEGFARAVSGLLADGERAARLGNAARARVQERYTWERLADTALAAYVTAGAKTQLEVPG